LTPDQQEGYSDSEDDDVDEVEPAPDDHGTSTIE
jgi:hypothetical protein